MENLTDLPISRFLEITASDAPVPGGGSIAALSGAIAGSLATMVARLTLGRKKYADREPAMKQIISTLQPLVERLTSLVEEDSKAYSIVMDAYRLPKETDDEKRARAAAIQAATVTAALVPLKVAETVETVMPLIEEVAAQGNSNAITDAGVAALSARAAVHAAILNVRINLGGIDDEAFVKEMTARCEALTQTADAFEKRVLQTVNSKI